MMAHPATAGVECPDQAVLMLTHSENPRILAHFGRLKREIAGLMASYLVFHHPARRSLFTLSKADIVLRERSFAAALPHRRAQMVRRGDSVRHYLDLIHTLAAAQRRTALYRHIWFVECDVDYSGDWRDFFAPLTHRQADLLTARIRYRQDTPDWSYWRTHRQPEDVPPSLAAKSFNPVARLSRRFLEIYRDEMSRAGWESHWEALYPTVALHHGLVVEDMLGTGAFGIGADDPSFEPPLTPRTYGYRPVRQTSYYFEEPSAFRWKDKLYHPVKVD